MKKNHRLDSQREAIEGNVTDSSRATETKSIRFRRERGFESVRERDKTKFDLVSRVTEAPTSHGLTRARRVDAPDA